MQYALVLKLGFVCSIEVSWCMVCALLADPSAEFFFKSWLADKKIQLISGLAEYSHNLRNSAGIWLTNDKFG